MSKWLVGKLVVASLIGWVIGVMFTPSSASKRLNVTRGLKSDNSATRVNLSYVSPSGRRYDHVLKVVNIVGPPGAIPTDKKLWCLSIIQDGERTDLHCKQIDSTAPLPTDQAPPSQ